MLEPGAILQERYLIETQLGQGGMGTIYRAIDQRFNRTVAVKESLLPNASLAKAFEREARLLNNLRHPCLPVVIDYFNQEPMWYLVMDYVPGDDLGALLKRTGGSFAPSTVLAWADRLLGALDFLHRQDPPILHRDVKPQNIKLTPQGEIVLLDFGLAKGATGQMTQAAEGASIQAYTPHYAPLEQIQGTGTDPRGDVYAAGATLYHLMTGVKPPDAVTRAVQTVSGRPDPLRPPHELNPEIPAAVSIAIERAMAQNAAQRFETGAAFRASLRAAAQTVPPVIPAGREAIPMEGVIVEQPISAPAAPPTGPAPMPHGGTVAADPSPRTIPMPSVNVDTLPGTRIAPKPSRWLAWSLAGIAVVALLGVAAIGGYFLSSSLGQTTASRDSETAKGTNEQAGGTELGLKEPGKAAPGLRPGTVSYSTPVLDSTGSLIRTEPGEARVLSETTGDLGLDIVEIPAGTFAMGTSEEVIDPLVREARRRYADATQVEKLLRWQMPQHLATVPRFGLGRSEVTQRQWRVVASWPAVDRELNPEPSRFKGDDLPVEQVSWEDAVEFCKRLSARTGRPYRLPSETEWEYACRGGTESGFFCGESITSDVANFDGRQPWLSTPEGIARGATTPVGSLGVANRFGLYDMAGNVFEWCQDAFHESYEGAPADGRAWTNWSGGDAPASRVLRGGSWQFGAGFCAAAFRGKDVATARWPGNGFRVALDAASLP